MSLHPTPEKALCTRTLRTGGSKAVIFLDDATAEAASAERENLAPSAADANAIVEVKVWLLGISPMVWRRVLVPSGCTLRELHGVFQVAMGWSA